MEIYVQNFHQKSNCYKRIKRLDCFMKLNLPKLTRILLGYKPSMKGSIIRAIVFGGLLILHQKAAQNILERLFHN